MCRPMPSARGRSIVRRCSSSRRSPRRKRRLRAWGRRNTRENIEDTEDTMLTFALLALAAVVSQAPADARQINLTAPQPVVAIDLGQIKGAPARLAWSPDGTQLYLQMVERDGAGRAKSASQYLVSVAQKTMKAVDKEPDWAAKYWTWKSAQASPGASGFKIDVSQKQETIRATATPTGGALAKGALTDPTAGTTSSDVAGASLQSQIQTVYTLRVKGE